MKKTVAIICTLLICCCVVFTACQTEAALITVKFNANYDGGVNPASQMVEIGVTIKLPSVSRDGYDFDGWHTTALGGRLVGYAGDDYFANYDVTLHAHWRKQGGGDEDVDNKKLVFYSTMNDKQSAITDKIIEIFEQKYDGWTVQHVPSVDYDTIYKQVVKDFDSNKQPDLAFCYAGQVASYIRSGKVVDLNKYVNSTTTHNGQRVGYTASEQADFIPVFFNEGIAGNSFGNYQAYGYDDETMFTLPFYKYAEVMYYNETALNDLGLQPATTWDELWQQCEAIKERFPDCTPLGYDSDSNFFITMCEQNGWGYTTASGEGAEHYLFNNDGVAEWLGQLRDYHEKGYVETQGTSEELMTDLFTKDVDGGVVYCVSGTILSPYYTSNKFTVGVTTVPGSKDGNNHVIALGPSVIMFSNDSEPNAAEREMMTFLFVKELLAPEYQAQITLAENYNFIPVRNSVYELDSFKQYVNGTSLKQRTMKLVQSFTHDLFTTAAFVGSDMAHRQVGEAIRNAITGQMSPTEALNDAYLKCIS